MATTCEKCIHNNYYVAMPKSGPDYKSEAFTLLYKIWFCVLKKCGWCVIIYYCVYYVIIPT